MKSRDNAVGRISRRLALCAMVACCACFHAAATQLYVSLSGIDTSAGTMDQPLKSITKAISLAHAGDTIYVRGGTYPLVSTIAISKSGTSGSRYNLFGYENERPLLDYSAMRISSSNRGINLSGSYWYIRGFDIRKAGDNGMNISGSNNIVEYCSFSENGDTGMQLGGGASNNRIINCDSYFNVDPSQGNADGFSPKLDVGSGNSFHGCRSWQNSDDGWDGYMRPSDNVTTTLDSCWVFHNGYLKSGAASIGNGNGFKMGGGDNSNRDSLRHNMILRNCLSFDNRVKGYDQNNNMGSMTLLNCTAYRNGANFQVTKALRITSVLTVKNCISAGTGGVSLLPSAVQSTNSWLSPLSASDADFVSVDTAGVTGPRKPDGSLPDVSFMHLVAGSRLIDAGTDVGLPFVGIAPDLGAFEYQSAAGMRMTASALIPRSPILEQNYPNPFNPSTTINYQLTSNSFVTLRVYNELGEEIATLVHGFQTAGTHEAAFSATHDGLPSGVYYYRLQTDEVALSRKMVLLK